MTDTIQSPKSPLWMRVALFGSLAVNLLIVGVVVGVVAFGGPHKRASGPRPDVGSLYTRALDQKDRRAIRTALSAELAGQIRDRGSVLAEFEATVETLRAVPFDQDALLAALAEQSTRRARRETVGRELLVAQIAAMTDADRAAYADRVEQGLADLAKRIRR